MSEEFERNLLFLLKDDMLLSLMDSELKYGSMAVSGALARLND
jgi:hypothetical protein